MSNTVTTNSFTQTLSATPHRLDLFVHLMISNAFTLVLCIYCECVILILIIITNCVCVFLNFPCTSIMVHIHIYMVHNIQKAFLPFVKLKSVGVIKKQLTRKFHLALKCGKSLAKSDNSERSTNCIQVPLYFPFFTSP